MTSSSADADRDDLVDTAYEEIQECIAFHQRLAYADAWDIDPDSDQLKGHEGIGEGTSECAHGVMETVNRLIDRLLADRAATVAEPDAVATPPLHMASVMSGGDPDWLDMALDSVGENCTIDYLDGPLAGWTCYLVYDVVVHEHENWTEREAAYAEGYGTTRKAAVLDAVQKAAGKPKEVEG